MVKFADLITDSWVPVSKVDAKRFEESTGTQIPKQLWNFLNKANGGEVSPAWALGDATDFRPTLFYSLNCDALAWRDLQTNYEIHEGRIPNCSIPFATSGEDLFAVDNRSGEVFLWIREDEARLTAEDNRTRLAKSIHEFIANMHIPSFRQRRKMASSCEEPNQSIEVHDLRSFTSWIKKNTPNEHDLLNCFRLACEMNCVPIARAVIDYGIEVTNSLLADAVDDFGRGDIAKLLLDSGMPVTRLRSRKRQDYIREVAIHWEKGLFGSRSGVTV